MAQHDPKPRYATVEEVAQTCRQSPRVVQRWCLDGLVIARKSPGGRKWRIEVDDEDWPREPELTDDRAA